MPHQPERKTVYQYKDTGFSFALPESDCISVALQPAVPRTMVPLVAGDPAASAAASNHCDPASSSCGRLLLRMLADYAA